MSACAHALVIISLNWRFAVEICCLWLRGMPADIKKKFILYVKVERRIT